MGKYRYVGIPEDLIEQVQEHIQNGQWGYRTISEFVIEAIRRRLEAIHLRQVEQLVEVPTVE